MYVVACKWISTGNSKYRSLSELLVSPNLTDAEREWITAAYEYSITVGISGHYIDYKIINDTESNNVISLTFYDSKTGYESVESLPETAPFLEARTNFLINSGLILEEIKTEIPDTTVISDITFSQASELFVSN